MAAVEYSVALGIYIWYVLFTPKWIHPALVTTSFGCAAAATAIIMLLPNMVLGYESSCMVRGAGTILDVVWGGTRRMC